MIAVAISSSLSYPAGVILPYLEPQVVLVMAGMALWFIELADSAVVAVVPPVSVESC